MKYKKLLFWINIKNLFGNIERLVQVEKQEILNKVMEYIERARSEYFQVSNKSEQYQSLHELARAERALIQIECLGIDLGIIQTGTI